VSKKMPMVDVGETETERRKRTLELRRLYTEASQCFRLALRRSPKIVPSMYARMALSFLRARDFGESLENANKALLHFKDAPRIYFIKGQALLELGRIDEAFTAFDQALVLAKELREKCNGKDQVDTRLIESYRKAAYAKKHKFVEKELILGEIEIESSDRRQREIDENLNQFNVYDSIPALLSPLKLPVIEVASKMVNPLSLRLKVCPPKSRFKRHKKRLKKKKQTPMKLPLISKGDEFSPVELLEVLAGTTQELKGVCQEEDEEDEPEEFFDWEDDEQGSLLDKDIVLEMEIETGDDILELTVRKDDVIGVVIDSFFEKHHKKFTHAQIEELRVELKSRLSDAQR